MEPGCVAVLVRQSAREANDARRDREPRRDLETWPQRDAALLASAVLVQGGDAMSWLLSVITACALLIGCGEDRISDATTAMIAKELETARISGFQARFALAQTDMDNERLAAEARN